MQHVKLGHIQLGPAVALLEPFGSVFSPAWFFFIMVFNCTECLVILHGSNLPPVQRVRTEVLHRLFLHRSEFHPWGQPLLC